VTEPQPHDSAIGLSLDSLAIGVDHLEAVVVTHVRSPAPFAWWIRRGASRDAAVIGRSAQLFTLASRDGAVTGDEVVTLTIESKSTLMIVNSVRNFGVAVVFAREAPLGFARMAAKQIVLTLEHDLPYELAEPVAVTPEPVSSAPQRHASTPPEPARVPTPPAVASERGARTGFAEPALVQSLPVASRPTVPGSVPPAVAPAPEVDFESENGPDTSPPRSAIGNRVRTILLHLERTAVDGHISRMRVALRSGLGLEALVYPDDLPAEALLVIETAAEDILGVEHGKLGELSLA
jgi:hypothetical protein